jgi:DNA-binding CsgD family transcriptional regulator
MLRRLPRSRARVHPRNLGCLTPSLGPAGATEHSSRLYVVDGEPADRFPPADPKGSLSTVATSPEQLRDDLVGLMHRGADLRGFALGAARILARAVPFEGVVVLTMDPATLVPTGAVVENGPPTAAYPQLRENEFRGEDFIAFRSLARSECHVATLSQATGGVMDRSERHREIMRPNGFGDELRAALVDGQATWGALVLMRGSDREPFSAAHAALVEAVTRHLAEGLRRALLIARDAPAPPEGEDAAGVIVLAPDDSTAFADEVAEAWIDELGGNEPLPPAVRAVASQARTVAAGPTCDGRIARARVRTQSGRWLIVRGSVLADGPDAQVAVMIEPARPHELAPLIADAYRLTDRERDVTRLVARGLSTDAIAARLHLSPWTVQDHLKAIFEKVGITTRGELVARVFFGQRAPQL